MVLSVFHISAIMILVGVVLVSNINKISNISSKFSSKSKRICYCKRNNKIPAAATTTKPIAQESQHNQLTPFLVEVVEEWAGEMLPTSPKPLTTAIGLVMTKIVPLLLRVHLILVQTQLVRRCLHHRRRMA